MPKLNEMHAKYKEKGFVLIGLHSDPKTDEGVAAVTKESMQFPVAFDGGAWMKKMGCDSFPDYVLIDKRGVTRVVDLANAEIERAVVKLLEE